ncbi:MAG: DUF3551 domain-containing protein [Xanthobacteraceae bacterium]
MRFVLAAILLSVAAGSALDSADARAFNRREQHWLSYHSPWCLHTMTEIEDCGFATFEQCDISRSGVGGSCDHNPRYVELPAAPRRSVARKSKRAAR